MMRSWTRLLFFTFILSLLAAGCTNEESLEGPVAPGAGQSDPVVEGGEPLPPEGPQKPEDPKDPAPIKNFRKTKVVGNYADKNVARPKKDSKTYHQSGQWQQSQLKGSRNSVSRYSSDRGAIAAYTHSYPRGGKICLSIFRVTHPNSTKQAKWTIGLGENLASQHLVNYRLPSKEKGWYHLGVVEAKANEQIHMALSFGEGEEDGFLRSDEVRFRYLKAGNDCFGKIKRVVKSKRTVIDNKANKKGKPKRVVGYRESRGWKVSSLKGYKNSLSKYSSEEDAKVTYSFYATKAATYCLAIYRMTHPNSTAQGLIRVHSSLEDDTYELPFNLEAHRKGFVSLGDYSLEEKSDFTVTLKRDPGYSSGFLRADAMRLTEGACPL